MERCPFCHSELQGQVSHRTTRGDVTPGQKSHGAEHVACPDCGEVIDGFASH
ncbi:MAG: hypothetical protein ABEJ70_07725 [Halobacteriaceae archaeon]